MKANRCYIIAVADDRNHLTPTSCLAARNHGGKQSAPDASPGQAAINVDRILDRIAIGGAGPIKSRVAVSNHSAVDFCYEIWQPAAECVVPATLQFGN